jgi:hypothetical protein
MNNNKNIFFSGLLYVLNVILVFLTSAYYLLVIIFERGSGFFPVYKEQTICRPRPDGIYNLNTHVIIIFIVLNIIWFICYNIFYFRSRHDGKKMLKMGILGIVISILLIILQIVTYDLIGC